MWLGNTWKLVVPLTACVFACHSACHLAAFLSNHDHLHFKLGSKLLGVGAQPLLWDMFLTGIFCVQHSLMSNSRTAEKCFGVYTRCVYTFATCIALKALITFWARSDHYVLWEVDTLTKPVLWWGFTIIHALGWLIIYTGCLLVDIGELLGAKQVYYSMASFNEPHNLKARSLKRYYKHMRHPSLVTFCILLFVHPVMRVDRFLLATLLAVYSYVRYSIDVEDYEYVKDLYEQKRLQMQRKL